MCCVSQRSLLFTLSSAQFVSRTAFLGNPHPSHLSKKKQAHVTHRGAGQSTITSTNQRVLLTKPVQPQSLGNNRCCAAQIDAIGHVHFNTTPIFLRCNSTC